MYQRQLTSLITKPLRRLLLLPLSTHLHSVLTEFGLPTIEYQQQCQQLKLLHRTLTFDASNNPCTALLQCIYTNRTVINMYHQHSQRILLATAPCTAGTNSDTVTSSPTPPVNHQCATNVVNVPPLPAKLASPPALSRWNKCTGTFLKGGLLVKSFQLFFTMITIAVNASVPLLFPFNDFVDQKIKPKLYFKTLSLKKSLVQLHNDSTTTAPLKSIKTTIGFSSYLKQLCNHRHKSLMYFMSHCRFNRLNSQQQRFRFHQSDSHHCLYCDTPHDTVEHILLDCPLHNNARYHCYNLLQSMNVPFTLPTLLNGNTSTNRSKHTSTSTITSVIYGFLEKVKNKLDKVKQMYHQY